MIGLEGSLTPSSGVSKTEGRLRRKTKTSTVDYRSWRNLDKNTPLRTEETDPGPVPNGSGDGSPSYEKRGTLDDRGGPIGHRGITIYCDNEPDEFR